MFCIVVFSVILCLAYSISDVLSLVWPIHPFHLLSECHSPLLAKTVFRCIVSNTQILLKVFLFFFKLVYIQLQLYKDYFYNGVLEIKCKLRDILSYILSYGITDYTNRFSPCVSTSIILRDILSYILSYGITDYTNRFSPCVSTSIILRDILSYILSYGITDYTNRFSPCVSTSIILRDILSYIYS